MADSHREYEVRYLEMLQRTVDRMAAESARTKQYCLTAVTALVAVTAASKVWFLAIAGAALVLCFWYLDAMYLRQERWFRAMYDDMLTGKVDTGAFTITPPKEIQDRHTMSDGVLRPSTWGLYGPLFVLLIVVAIAVAFAD